MTARSPRHPLPLALAAALVACLPLAGCTSDGGNVVSDLLGSQPRAAVATAPSDQVVVLDGRTAAALSVQAADAVWTSSPVAVVVAPGSRADARAAASAAQELAVPAFALPAPEQASPSPGDSAAAGVDPGSARALQATLARLGVQAVLAVGEVAPEALGGVHIVTSRADLPEFTGAPAVAATTALLAPRATTRAAVVAEGSLRAAGVATLELANRDPRQRAADVTAMADSDAQHFIAVGAGFGPASRLTTRVRAAITGVQLPGGGQTVFHDKRYVALYGHPLTGALGVLGEQDPAASVTRARSVARPYQQFTSAQVIPAFEVIATVAAGSAGKDGNYSNEWDPEVLRPVISAARRNGIYVVLDLQSGMSDFLSQAKLYKDLLKDPQVGLALDPEWKLKPGQKPLAQFGSVDAREINATSRWLAKLVRDNDLPQKMFLLHQFRLDMITNRDKIDMSHDELAYVSQMDGTGTYAAKRATWDTVTAHSPATMKWGWKNFYDEDRPTMTPRQTYTLVRPKPWWVSYQ